MNNLFLSIVLPAFNEQRRIGLTLTHMQAYLSHQAYDSEVIVVDDGSQDGTSRVVEGYAGRMVNLRLLRNGRNRGKGYSVRQGILSANGQYVGFADADYKTPIEELNKILPWLEQGYDVLIGSRGLDSSRVEVPQPKYRQIGARVFAVLMHALIGLPDIVDTQCGFKFYPREVARDLFSRQVIDGYMFDVEILCLAQRLGYRVKEVPIRWMNDPDSRLQLIRGNMRNMKELVQIRISLNGMARERTEEIVR